MVQCSVLFCENDSLKQQHISFHQVPPHAWEQSAFYIQMESQQEMFVCSNHFKASDFTKDQHGNMQLKNDAVPFIQVCRICLQSDVKLIDMYENNLKYIYQSVVGVDVDINNKTYFNNMLCLECAQRLMKCHTFKEKGIWSDSILMNLAGKNKQISKEILTTLNLKRLLLKSTLNYKHYEPNYCDITLNHDDIISKINVEEPVDVKFEDKGDFDEIKHDVKNENEIEMEIPEPNTEYVDNDCDYSSDDDLTLKQIEQQNERKRTVKKKARLKKEETPKIDRRHKALFIDGVNGNLFTIVKLSVEEQKEEILKRKETLNYKNSPLKCMECFKGFLDDKAYTTHMLRHSDEFGAFACPICHAHFKTQSKVTKHKTAIHCYEYRCNECPFITTNRQSAKLHESWHRGKMYKCSHCNDVFTKFTTYMGHLRIKHPSDFVCELCGFAFVSVKGIKQHKKLKHISSEKVPADGPLCETCNIRFISEEALHRHLYVSARHKNESNSNHGLHPNRPPYRPVKSVQRMKSDDTQDPNFSLQNLTCEQCGMQMSDSRSYHQHFRKMHPDKNRTLYPSMKTPCMCEKCGKLFQSFALLKDHSYIHTNERRFKCPDCDKTFRMKQRLNTHMYTHKQQRYPCHVCGKSFSNVGNRQRHMIIHTGLRPHKCEMCLKTFKTSTEKKTHVNYVHLKKPWPKRSRGRRSSGKQGQSMQTTQEVSETDIQTWPPCEKLALNVISDKPVYYLKI